MRRDAPCTPSIILYLAGTSWSGFRPSWSKDVYSIMFFSNITPPQTPDSIPQEAGRQIKGYEGRAPRRRAEEPTLGDKWKAMKGDKTNEGRQGSNGSQEQPRMEIMQETNEGRQGGRGNQEQPRVEIMQGDKAAGAAKSSPEWRSCRETNEGRQGGSGITTIWRLWGSATESLRSKNPYSFQLSGEQAL